MKKVFSVIIVAFAALFPWSFAAAEEVPCSKIAGNWGGRFEEREKTLTGIPLRCSDGHQEKVSMTTLGKFHESKEVPYEGKGELSATFNHGFVTMAYEVRVNPDSGKTEEIMQITHTNKSSGNTNRAVLTKVSDDWLKQNFPQFSEQIARLAPLTQPLEQVLVVASSQ